MNDPLYTLVISAEDAAASTAQAEADAAAVSESTAPPEYDEE